PCPLLPTLCPYTTLFRSEARSKRRAGAALRALLELGARDVAVLRDGVEQRIATQELVVGDRFVVRPGEKIATDGVVEQGNSAVRSEEHTSELQSRFDLVC